MDGGQPLHGGRERGLGPVLTWPHGWRGHDPALIQLHGGGGCMACYAGSRPGSEPLHGFGVLAAGWGGRIHCHWSLAPSFLTFGSPTGQIPRLHRLHLAQRLPVEHHCPRTRTAASHHKPLREWGESQEDACDGQA